MNKEIEYGKALYEVAKEAGIEENVKSDFSQISQLLEENEEFSKLLSNPRIPVSERIAILDSIFINHQIEPYLLSVLKIFTENKDMSLIPLCYKSYLNQYHEDKNIMVVTAISAIELDESQREQVKAKLSKMTGKTIVLENRIDKTCIGGIRLEYRGHMIDASIKNRFKKLQQDIISADYS